MSTASPSSTSDWRERKKAQTRRMLQEQAMRLFLEKGFEATTVEEIAAAAGVSHMTFFRYFPTKEDVVDYDDYDQTLAERIAARPSGEPPLDMIRHALTQDDQVAPDPAEREGMLTRMRLVLDTPALRARSWEHKNADERLIAGALAAHPGHDPDALHTRVIAAAAVAAMTAAFRAWAENDGRQDLRELIDAAFDILSDPRAEPRSP
ncbi:acyl-CoA-like ligand-binding transcription factor [Actinomadura opuntiae]|uniref:acyl-CoA-like ligand-binding transcription factor n=1 Tax=Actinomadura sp. OS1-43 TaxID=604315 RepID=UPI00255A8BA3|nr:TetR family transcriptional regulator [Actinomadura sp. OS1-43]MDL4815447.1 TetR family transcriptional regulator [Actinomadura sp. OS1-43]